MKPFQATVLFVFIASVFFGCGQNFNQEELDKFSRHQLVEWNLKLTDVLVADIFTPPQASRIYAYPNIAAYEVMRNGKPGFTTLAGQLTDFTSVPAPKIEEEFYLPVSSIIAFTTVSQKLVYNQQMIQDMEAEYLSEIKKIGIPSKMLENSVAYGEEVGNHILAWAQEDGYVKRQALPRYTLMEEAGKWEPTPPDYMQAIEPHWNTIRPFVIDSANQFVPPAPTAFDTLPGSKFYEESMEVYTTVKNLDDEQMEIAKFWDCNPNISYTRGHVMFYEQQISPGGHWICITGIASKKENLDITETAEVHAMVSIALADAFISCWDEKYRSSLIRPETYINRYIDPDWKPILQTPAFPEHTSGHSVISSSAATMLTNILGDSFAFTDSSEVKYGLPVREYDSFVEASLEAAVSRLYGGIHYRPAIDYGVDQGKKVGGFVFEQVKTRQHSQETAGRE